MKFMENKKDVSGQGKMENSASGVLSMQCLCGIYRVQHKEAWVWR